MRKITTAASGFFSVPGRALQHALDLKQFFRNELCIGGAICAAYYAAQLLHSTATVVGGSLGYLTSCLVGGKNSDTANTMVGWIILAALLVQMLKMGYNKFSQTTLARVENMTPSQHAAFAEQMQQVLHMMIDSSNTTAGDDSAQPPEPKSKTRDVLPRLAGVLNTTETRCDSMEDLASQLVQEQNEETNVALRVLVDALLAEQQTMATNNNSI